MIFQLLIVFTTCDDSDIRATPIFFDSKAKYNNCISKTFHGNFSIYVSPRTFCFLDVFNDCNVYIYLNELDGPEFIGKYLKEKHKGFFIGQTGGTIIANQNAASRVFAHFLYFDSNSDFFFYKIPKCKIPIKAEQNEHIATEISKKAYRSQFKFTMDINKRILENQKEYEKNIFKESYFSYSFNLKPNEARIIEFPQLTESRTFFIHANSSLNGMLGYIRNGKFCLTQFNKGSQFNINEVNAYLYNRFAFIIHNPLKSHAKASILHFPFLFQACNSPKSSKPFPTEEMIEESKSLYRNATLFIPKLGPKPDFRLKILDMKMNNTALTVPLTPRHERFLFLTLFRGNDFTSNSSLLDEVDDVEWEVFDEPTGNITRKQIRPTVWDITPDEVSVIDPSEFKSMFFVRSSRASSVVIEDNHHRYESIQPTSIGFNCGSCRRVFLKSSEKTFTAYCTSIELYDQMFVIGDSKRESDNSYLKIPKIVIDEVNQMNENEELHIGNLSLYEEINVTLSNGCHYIFIDDPFCRVYLPPTPEFDISFFASKVIDVNTHKYQLVKHTRRSNMMHGFNFGISTGAIRISTKSLYDVSFTFLITTDYLEENTHIINAGDIILPTPEVSRPR